MLPLELAYAPGANKNSVCCCGEVDKISVYCDCDHAIVGDGTGPMHFHASGKRKHGSGASSIVEFESGLTVAREIIDNMSLESQPASTPQIDARASIAVEFAVSWLG